VCFYLLITIIILNLTFFLDLVVFIFMTVNFVYSLFAFHLTFYVSFILKVAYRFLDVLISFI